MPRGIPNQAKNTPVMAPSPEIDTRAIPIPQKSPIDIGHALENAPAGIEIVERLPAADYADELKFNEDPVTVVINPSTDPKAAKVVFCAIDNKGAEVWDEKGKRWVQFKWVPVNRVLTIKRKYLEVLARSRVDTFATREVTPTPMANQDGFVLEANTVQVAPFTVRHDPAGERGHNWLTRVLSEF